MLTSKAGGRIYKKTMVPKAHPFQNFIHVKDMPPQNAHHLKNFTAPINIFLEISFFYPPSLHTKSAPWKLSMKSQYLFSTVILMLCPATAIFAAPLTEREELTLSLNQLSQIETSLHRAQQSARTGINERYYFDYPRILDDITTLRSGIENYLTPARSQPRDTATLVGQYREEKTSP